MERKLANQRSVSRMSGCCGVQAALLTTLTPGMGFVLPLRAPFAHARLTALDLEGAGACRGSSCCLAGRSRRRSGW